MTRLPAEWEPHERTVMCWPARADLWGRHLADAERAYADVAAAISRFEPVTMIATPGSVERAASLCSSAGRGASHDIDLVELAIDDSWFRDSGPIFVIDDDGARRALDWTFNSWGGKFVPYDDDATIARRWAAEAGHQARTVDMVLEGGSISSDGNGTIVTTTQCLMHPNRNPHLDQREIERRLLTEFGAEHLVWLPHGMALDTDTDGHVDNVAAFYGPDHLLVQGCDDPDEDDAVRMNVNRRVAEAQIGTVTEVPVLPFVELDGERLVVPYLNFYVGNGFVAVPVCGHEADDDMVTLIGEHFPGRETVALDVGTVLAKGGGGIHCITQQVPSG